MSTITPYYRDETALIYCGDCREIELPFPSDVALVLTDPPYGIGVKTSYGSAGRSALSTAHDYEEIEGDGEPFDPSWLVKRANRMVLWGANHYADKLPPSSSWIVWDKLNGLVSEREVGFNDSADCELAWTNIGGPARLFSHRWIGMLRDSELDRRGWHPTQKPVSLMAWILNGYTKLGDLILDPYMGSGPVAEACKLTGRKYVGVELNESYCERAVSRLAQGVMFGEAS